MEPRIQQDLLCRYHMPLEHIEAVQGGYLNQKWRAQFGGTPLLIKQYSPLRYSPQKLAVVERSLHIQATLQAQGIPCQKVMLFEGGAAVRHLASDLHYAVMEYLPGRHLRPGEVTTAQMHSLGETLGRMHGLLQAMDTTGMPPSLPPSLEELHAQYEGHIVALQALPGGQGDLPLYQRALHIVSGLHSQSFAGLPMGLLHRDFAIDNILFCEDALCGVIDGDSYSLGHIDRDVGRALLSFCLDEALALRPELVLAFRDGYAIYRPLTRQNMADAMRIVWLFESGIWLDPAYRSKTRDKVRRFVQETIWLTNNWFSLETLLPQ